MISPDLHTDAKAATQMSMSRDHSDPGLTKVQSAWALTNGASGEGERKEGI